MKTTITILALLLLTSCGRPNIEACDGDYTYNICRLFYNEVGAEKDREIDKLQEQLDILNYEISEVQSLQEAFSLLVEQLGDSGIEFTIINNTYQILIDDSIFELSPGNGKTFHLRRL